MAIRVSIVLDELTKNKVVSTYQSFQKDNKGEYIVFFAKRPDLVVTIYASKKVGEYKVLFIGDNALEEARVFDSEAQINPKKEKGEPARWLCLEDQIGSDEVGTGDFFGPICVCAAYVSKKDIPFLKKLGVDDSKRIKDEQIIEIGKQLIKKIPYSQVSLGNEKYNQLVDENMNMNEMKAKLHNQVLLNLKKKFPAVSNFFIDEFTEKENYFKYLSDTKEVVDNLNFKTKGESYFPCVAVGSIIARYSFLQKMEALGKKYGMEFPFGSSLKVDDFTKKFVKKFGLTELRKVCKSNFVNYKKLTK